MNESVQSILNVDDYLPGRYARTKVLQQAGFLVLEASTGEETLQAIAQHKPALVLLDVNLPDMTGFQVCRQIRKNPESSGTTIVHVSASSVQNFHLVNGLDSGADGYLVEPVDPSVLVATVKAFLRARRAEEALRRSNEELEWFAYRAAHDLNEPLRTITAYTQILERGLKGQLDERQAKSMQFILDAGQRMSTLIDGLLKYAQASHSGSDLKLVSMEAMFARVLANCAELIRSTGTIVTHDCLPEVVADQSLEEVFQNLISNAIKYRRDGVAPHIHVSARPEGEMLRFSIQDNGIGIKPEDQAAIFNVFRRLHGHNIPGSGIGLALAQKIVSAHGGSIWVESKPGAGSTFFFTVLREREAAATFSTD
jgi:signal transduction histidine kinase